MELLISHVVVGSALGVGGLVAGWIMRQASFDKQSLAAPDPLLMRQYLSALQGLSSGMATHVDEHNATLRTIDGELSGVGNGLRPDVKELVQKLLAANENIQAKLQQSEHNAQEIASRISQYAKEARTDVLTGLVNRRGFEEEFERCQSTFFGAGQPFSLIMVDIDQFKQFNDQYGHLVGDEVLHSVGQVLSGQSSGRDLPTRYGGEEFAVLLPETQIDRAKCMAESLRRAIEKTQLEHENKSFRVTVSAGAAEVLSNERAPELIRRADEALYSAKEAGRNCVYWHDGTRPQPLSPTQLDGGEDMQCEKEEPTNIACQKSASVQQAVTPAEPAARVSNVTQEVPSKEQYDLLTARDVDPSELARIGNKMMFCKEVRQRIGEFHHDGVPFSTILLRIDDNEKITRSGSERAGQLILSVAAEKIREQIGKEDTLALFDDLTLGVLLLDAPLRRAVLIGERLREAIRQTVIQVGRLSFRFTISQGVAEVRTRDDMESLIERVRDQLEVAQKGGGNRTSYSAHAPVTA